MTLMDIRDLAALTDTANILEIEVLRGDQRVCIKRSTALDSYVALIPNLPAMPAISVPGRITGSTCLPPAPSQPASLTEVKAPMLGTYYEAPKSGSKPFVQVGDSVKRGQVLCIIEALKLPHEIKSATAGTVTAAHMKNGQPVEYGQLLFTFQTA